MKFQKQAKFTLWCSRAIAVVVVLLCFFLYDLLNWYHSFRELSWQASAAIFVGYYLCVPAVLFALWSMDRLLKSILAGDVFIFSNARRIQGICLCCGFVSLVSLLAGVFYPPLLFLFVIMAFLALTVSVVKNVMAAAVEIREENDLTI